jgi:hypothetical protein
MQIPPREARRVVAAIQYRPRQEYSRHSQNIRENIDLAAQTRVLQPPASIS